MFHRFCREFGFRIYRYIEIRCYGIGGLESDSNYDTRIFALATLLCSTLAFNSLGSIDENAITSLSFIANLTQSIKLRAQDSSRDSLSSTNAGDQNDHGASPDSQDEDALEFHKFFPSFIWVVRDFALDLVDEDGYEISPDEYLDQALAPQTGNFDAEVIERNNIRRMLTAFFTERHAVPLVRPLSDESNLQQVDEVPMSELRPEFLEGLDRLQDRIHSTMRPKSMNGRSLSGLLPLPLRYPL